MSWIRRDQVKLLHSKLYSKKSFINKVTSPTIFYPSDLTEIYRQDGLAVYVESFDNQFSRNILLVVCS